MDSARRSAWDSVEHTLGGVSRVVGGATYKIVIAANGHGVGGCSACGAAVRIRTVDEIHGPLELSLDADNGGEVAWRVSFMGEER